MPTPTVVGEIFEVTIHLRVEGQQVLNVLHFQTVTGNSDVELRLLRALLDCVVALMPHTSGATVLERVTGKRVTPDVGPVMEVQPTEGQAAAGTVAGDAHVSFASCLISKRSVRGGRSGLGRMFMGGIPEAAAIGSSFNIGHPYYTAILAFITCVATKFIQSGESLNVGQLYQLGIMSRKIGGAKPPFLPAGFARVTSLRANPLIKSTVSRKVGRGS